jgi:hypothetical protein
MLRVCRHLLTLSMWLAAAAGCISANSMPIDPSPASRDGAIGDASLAADVFGAAGVGGSQGTGGSPGVPPSGPSLAVCTGGERRCLDGACRVESASACGPACQTCPAGANGTPTCSEGKCGLSCVSPAVACDQRCIRLDRGECCSAADCVARPPSVSACQGGACVWVCPARRIECEGACVAAEDLSCCHSGPDVDGNSIPDCRENLVPNGHFGVGFRPWNDNVTDGTVEWSPMDSRSLAGSGSLKLTNNYPDPVSASVLATRNDFLPVKPSTDYTLFLDYYIPPNQRGMGSALVEIASFEADGTRFKADSTSFRAVGAWTKETFSFTTAPTTGTITLELMADKSAGESFTVFYDNVLIRPR